MEAGFVHYFHLHLSLYRNLTRLKYASQNPKILSLGAFCHLTLNCEKWVFAMTSLCHQAPKITPLTESCPSILESGTTTQFCS